MGLIRHAQVLFIYRKPRLVSPSSTQFGVNGSTYPSRQLHMIVIGLRKPYTKSESGAKNDIINQQ
jgi:hypothetical protein